MRRPESRARTRALSPLMLASLLLAAVACGTVTSPDAVPMRAGAMADARTPTSVCHPRGNGTWVLITVGSERGATAHYEHGDGAPGIPIPGNPAMKFGPDCEPVPRFTSIEGTWQGTYSWNCGGTRTGSTELILQLFERGNGSIYGVAIYLGDDPEVIEYLSYRMVNPVYRPNGTLLGGTRDPDGLVVRLAVGNSPSQTSVYNEFDGAISADYMTMSGGTLNGDSATPTSRGCSAVSGYSGTWTVTHIN